MHEEETQLTPDVESAPPAKRPTRGGAERWTDAHDNKLIEIVLQTLREDKKLNDAWRRGCVEIDRKHDHAASADKNRPCPACEDRWHRKLKKQFLPEPGSTSESDSESESESESESNHSEIAAHEMSAEKKRKREAEEVEKRASKDAAKVSEACGGVVKRVARLMPDGCVAQNGVQERSSRVHGRPPRACAGRKRGFEDARVSSALLGVS